MHILHFWSWKLKIRTRRAREIREAIYVYKHQGNRLFLFYGMCTDVQANTIKRLLDKEK